MQGPAVGPAWGNLAVGPPVLIYGVRGKARGDQLLFNSASQQGIVSHFLFHPCEMKCRHSCNE